MKPYTKAFNQQQQFFSKENPVVVFNFIVNLFQNHLEKEVGASKLAEDLKKFKINAEMQGKSNSNTDW
jgi:hypothetical protein